MSSYNIVISDQNNNNLGEITNWLSLAFSRQLNDFSDCTFTVPATDSKLQTLTALRRYRTKIYRNGTLVWAGEQALRSANLRSGSANVVKIKSFDYTELLAHRFTSDYRRFDNVDAGTMAWTLINESQLETYGDYGITQGTIETTKNRSRTYENKNILEAIQELTKVNDGFDFEITPDLEFNVYDRKGVDRTNTTVFEWGTNIENIAIDEDFSSPINQTIVLAEDERVVRTNTTSAGIYHLRQDVVSAFGVTESTTANDKGDSNNNKYRSTLTTIGFKQLSGTSPQFGSLSLGDSVKVRVQYGIYNINNNYRIYGYNVDVSQDNKESIEYTIGII